MIHKFPLGNLSITWQEGTKSAFKQIQDSEALSREVDTSKILV